MHYIEGDIRPLSDSFRVSIVGASGYSGLELTKLLVRHSRIQIEQLFANTMAGRRVADVHPMLGGRIDAVYAEYSPDAACASNLVFIALPSGEAMNLIPELLNRGKKVVDLGGDFRLRDAAQYERYYHRPHRAPELLPNAVYGLPEWHGEAIKATSLLANPGCYPTGAILPLAPLLKERLILDEGIVVNSLSGVSGAGRSASTELSFAEVNESVRAYKVGQHQHIPEINEALQSIINRPVSVTFVPHLVPLTRGIYTSIYATLTKGVSSDDVNHAYRRAYDKASFIRVSSSEIPELKNVVHTNFLDIGFRVDEVDNRLMLFSAIDNLLKGAAGQAVQNMNLMFGLNEKEGLL
jgi:N-acetyl-gamma-glutamyl-phosphate reductase